MSSVDAPPPSEPGRELDEIETVDGVPVLAEVRELAPAPAPAAPAVTIASAAATGFLAGAATYALLHRRAARRVPGASLSASLRGPDTARRTYLVHVVSRRVD